ncbi:hypothetical protein [Stenotrophomonas sp. MMGLT7]|uniref:hypothetical protein n=1 Tax=Stenotrophomonas sp. MMGLT7 TaxID=2901227 RepID=UPI001E3BDF14|nr:hypothetical protein [Stenotrophomonas sp. MMGLT7]MCD7097187.1 hypothetical protein [Stenotrophomonas sp. MMGLT7]
MASESVSTRPNTESGSPHDLWLMQEMLTVGLTRDSKGFPPEADHCVEINRMIQGLARAARSVVYQAGTDTTQDAQFAMQPIDEIAAAIILLSQLSEAVRIEASKGN